MCLLILSFVLFGRLDDGLVDDSVGFMFLFARLGVCYDCLSVC